MPHIAMVSLPGLALAYPSNYVLWYAVAARLAERYHAMLAGYGDSSLPEPGRHLVNYSLRVMAEDMESLGHRHFFLAGPCGIIVLSDRMPGDRAEHGCVARS